MKTSVLNLPTESTAETRRQSRDNYWIESLRISELRYRRLFETAQDGILILDANSGEIMDVNPFLLDLLDYPFEELRGRKLWEIGQFKDIAANRAAFEKLQEKEYIRYENLPLRRKDGKQIHVEFVSNVYWVDKEKVIQCNIRDITARAESGKESDSHKAALELCQSAKDAWLLTHAEGMRTPMMEIGSMLGLMELENTLLGSLPAEEKTQFNEAALRHVRANFQHLVRSFNELAVITAQSSLRLAKL